MTRPTVYFFDVVTKEEFTREMNDEEFAAFSKRKEEIEKQEQLRLEEEAQLAAKAEAKKQALAALGLSQEVVNLLAE
jgi:hypothetical protein